MNLSVALCTYNGEKYISEQLQSIATQTVLPDELIICDDHSTDATVGYINRFAEAAPFPVRIYCNDVSLGVIHNFEKAISLCMGDYIALSDQDDVWLPDKIEKSMALMKSEEAKHAEGNTPILVHTDLKVVNENLDIMSSSLMHLQKFHNENSQQALRTLLVQNYVTGCTVVINRKLKEIATPFPINIIMHDWWLALFAASEGEIAFLDESTILYRQHGANAVGAKKYFSTKNIKKVLNFRKMENQIKKTIKQVDAFVKYKPQVDLQGRKYAIAYLKNLRNNNYLPIFRLGIHKQGFLRNTLFYLFLIFTNKE